MTGTEGQGGGSRLLVPSKDRYDSLGKPVIVRGKSTWVSLDNPADFHRRRISHDSRSERFRLVRADFFFQVCREIPQRR
jgi:hypothetical protein